MFKFSAALMTLICAGGVLAQDFPNHALRVVVPFPPGGAADIIGRTLAQPLSRAFSQSVIVENRPGANTAIGAEVVARARARPGELTFGTASILGGQRLAGELFRETVGINIINVPYNGGAPATTAAMGGHTSMLVSNVVESAPQVLAGRLRGIAVTSLARSDVLPNVPTVAESGYPGFEALNWFGAVARAGPKPMIERLSKEIARALELPEVKDQMARQGMSPAAMNPEAYDAFLRAEAQRNERIIRTLKLKIE